MGSKLRCKICGHRRYWDNRKFFNDERLCFDCAIIMDFNVQHLIPVSERNTTTIWPRSAYKKIPKLQWYTLQRGDTQEYKELKVFDDRL